MRSALLVSPLLLCALLPRPARAESAAPAAPASSASPASSAHEAARATGHLLADDDLIVDRGFWTAPLDGGALGVATRVLLARTDSTAGRGLLFQAEVVVQIPFERWLGRRPRVPASLPLRDPLDHRRDDQGYGELETTEMNTMSDGIWKKHAGLTAAVAGLALAPAAAGQEAGQKKVAPTTSTLLVAAPGASAPAPSVPTPSAAPSASVIARIAGAPQLTASGLRTLVAGAIRQAGLERDEEIDGLAARARWSALAPEVRLRALRGVDAGARVYRSDDVADRWTGSDGTSTLVEGRLSWRLDRLVFADEEVALERIRLERSELKQRITHRVIELAMRWLRARRTAGDPEALPRERDEAAAVELESVVALDALTGGLASPILFSPSP